MAARRIIVAYFAVEVALWVLMFAGVGGKEPPLGYLVGDLIVGAALSVGLWLQWRAVWWVLVVGTFLGLVLSLAWLIGGRHVGNQAVVLAGGLIEFALLLAPPLRRGLRPLSSIRAARA